MNLDNLRWLKKSISVGTILFTLPLFTSCSSDSEDPFEPTVGESDFVLFINELNAGGDPVDWIEIYNPGTEMVQLEGFYLFDNVDEKYRVPSGFSVPAGGFIRFICDGASTGNRTNFRLSADGEQIVLQDPSENVVDFIDYPRIRDGQFYGRYPDGSSSLYISGVSSPDATNGTNPGPALQRLNREPLVPTSDESVTVTVEAFHQQGSIASLELFYRLDNGDFISSPMELNGDTTYQGTIPPSLGDASVEYYVRATDADGTTSNRPFRAPNDVESYVISSSPLPALFINELMAINDSCCPDTDGGSEEFDDWLEIFNGGSSAIDIGGMYISDDPSDPFQFQFPTNESATIIAPGGFLLIWMDGDSDQGVLHTEVRLSGEGESIGLYTEEGRLIDSYEFGAQESDVSIGRSPDGTNNWVSFQSPTPGASN